VTIDLRVEEWLRWGGVNGVAQVLMTDDLLEGVLRQLAAAREFKLTGDSVAARAILAMKRPTDSVLPPLLAEESRAYSTAVYKQGLRTRGRGKGKDDNDEGKGKGKKGAQGANQT